MSSYTVLRDVGESLKTLIKDNISELSDENSILFDSPGDMNSSTSSQLSIFLFQANPNPHLRNMPPAPRGLTQLTYPPLSLDLSYLFTPYAQTRETELVILEKLLQLLHDNGVLRGTMLKGNLKESGNSEIRLVPSTMSIDDLNKLWAIFPNKAFKISLNYLLTPVYIPSARVRDVTRVVEKNVGSDTMERS